MFAKNYFDSSDGDKFGLCEDSGVVLHILPLNGDITASRIEGCLKSVCAQTSEIVNYEEYKYTRNSNSS